MSKILKISIAIVVFILIIVMMFVINRDDSGTTFQYDFQANFIPQFPNTNKNGLVIRPQKANGQVFIEQAYLEKSGFIVVHSIERDYPAKVIAASQWLGAGLHKNITFPGKLTEATYYFGLLYEDDGNKIFNIQKDKRLPLFWKVYNDEFVAQFITE